MEDFLDQVFLSTPWPDVNRSSWVGNTASQTDGFLVDALGAVYEGNEKNLQSSTASSTQTIRSNVNGLENDIYDPENGLHVVKGNIELLSENRHQDGKMQLQRLVETGLKGESLNASSSATFAQLSTKLPGPFEANGNGSSAVEQFLRDSPVLSTWIPQYRTVPVPSPITGQERLQAFGLQNEVAENEGGILEAKHGQFGSLSTTFEQDDMQRAHIPNFSGGQLMMPGAARGVQIQIEVPPSEETNSMPHYANQYAISQFQSPTAAGVGGQGTSKPRARARRGQATDPHSIAERLRREKIAERLKNLQELVPNSNKTDKASSLDEIIEYVKFLQHQVKILSMSRLGAAGAVLPLIADAQSDVGSRSLLLPETVGQKTDLTDSPDDIAFEQEIVKLMESNITSAMQFLQTKGLCLMPIALAAAISNGKLSSDTPSSGWIKPVAPITVAPNGTATSVSSIESGVQNEIRDELLIDGSYGAVKPEVHK